MTRGKRASNRLSSGIVDPPFARRYVRSSRAPSTEPRVGSPRQHPRQKVRLVVVRVNDVDVARRRSASEELAEDARIERPAFHGLDIVDAERSGTLADREDLVTSVPDVTDRHRYTCRIGSRRAKQNRLLGPASRAAHAAELEHANRPSSRFRACLRDVATSCRVRRATLERRWPPRGRDRRRSRRPQQSNHRCAALVWRGTNICSARGSGCRQDEMPGREQRTGARGASPRGRADAGGDEQRDRDERLERAQRRSELHRRPKRDAKVVTAPPHLSAKDGARASADRRDARWPDASSTTAAGQSRAAGTGRRLRMSRGFRRIRRSAETRRLGSPGCRSAAR